MGIADRHVPVHQVSCGVPDAVEDNHQRRPLKAETTTNIITNSNGAPSGYKMPSSSPSSDTSSSSESLANILLDLICESQAAAFWESYHARHRRIGPRKEAEGGERTCKKGSG